MAGGSDANGLEQCAECHLARVPVQIVYTVITRIKSVDSDFVLAFDLEAPRLRIVTARRPATQLENLFADSHVLHLTPSCRRAIAKASLCSGLPLPHGRQVRAVLFL